MPKETKDTKPADTITTAPVTAAATTEHTDSADLGAVDTGYTIDLDRKVERLIPWTLTGFQIEKNTRIYTSKDGEKSMRVATAFVRLKASADEAPFYTPITITIVQPVGQRQYIKAALPATQRAGGAYAVGAIGTDTPAGQSAVAAWKDAMLKGPFAKWAKSQDLAGLLKKGATAANVGTEMDLGFSL
jgi:hypothetical protein